ncbi:TetR family transcriptional regulator [Nocardioides albidus]|uniref:TetR family transcriptional regulator n=1 Tax=Nocardioides albidus TaxID=1517589 RepID=A0A5C4WL73_9ACTN|nr:TetR/AcrR family transcriptional regulator [Nocardioides albidus]TNM48285.1 TetR family transcriptional regulator [Nocardioides albidus]
MPRPRIRTEELANEIRRAALEIVRTEGLDAMTTRRVASAAGTNIAALNQLFGSRDGLVNAVALEGFELLAASLPSADRGLREGLGEYADAYRRFSRAEPALAEVMSMRPVSGPIPDGHGALRCRQVVVDILRSTSELDADDIEPHAVAFAALLAGLAVQERNGLLGRTAAHQDRVWRVAVAVFAAGLLASR